MNPAAQELTEEYLRELSGYLAGGGEQALRRAYELGRKAVADKLGVLEMASIHHQSLESLLSERRGSSDGADLTARAATFFAESLSPFEMAFRGFQEANSLLRRNLEELLETEDELRRQNERLAEAHQAVESERRRYRELFDSAPDGYVVTDLEGTIQEANSAASSMFQVRRAALPGMPLLLFVAEDEQPAFRTEMARLAARTERSTPVAGQSQAAQDLQVRMRGAAGPPFHVALTVSVVGGEQDKPAGLRWLIRDITERKRMEEERNQFRIREQVAQAEAESARRMEFLAEASRMLASSLDYETTLSSIAQLAVPYLADWCFVYIVEEDSSVRQLTVAHSDPEKAALADRLQGIYGPESRPPQRVMNVLQSGRGEIVHDVPQVWPDTAGDDELGHALGALAFRSAMLVPLTARGRTLGAITFLARAADRYGLIDLQLAEELARRCALAVDNARLYRQVIVERDKAEKASRAKDEFVAILSHELRNPLMPILGWARVFKNQPTLMQDSVLGEGVRSLERNAQTVARLVEDCLDLARISSRKISLSRELIDLNDVIEGSIEAVRERAEVKGLKFVVQLSPTPLWLLGDRTRISQAVMNLLTNAVRYTDNAGIIALRTCRAESEAEVEVKDTGVGIASEFLEHIFEPFRQVTPEWLTADVGLGLGLAIVKQIVQAHGGRVLAESRGPGCGSTFRIRLPLTVATQAAVASAGPEHAEARSASLAGPLRVLFIEDSMDILSLMKMELESIGFSVLTASDGESGLQMAMRERPDLIVSDIKIPGIDGYELIRRLRQHPDLAATPAIAMTGFGMQKDIEEAISAGYNAHLTKPVDTHELCAVIEKLTSQVQKT